MSLLPVQNQPTSLAGAGNSIGDTTLILSSFLAIDGTTPLTMAMFGSKGFATLEPGNGTNEEQMSFTGITQNANGTATLTGISTVLFISPYTETSGLTKTHPGGSQFVISNTSGFYNQFAILSDAETITGLWTFPNGASTPLLGVSYVAPTLQNQVASKGYADSLAVAGAPNATTAVKGIVQEAIVAEINAGTGSGSTGAELFVQPAKLLASAYGLQLPTSAQKDALAGTGTPSAANKFVTADTNALNQTLANLSTNTSLGSSNTLYPSQNAVKTYVDLSSNGTTTKNAADASTTQNIAHGLGRTPHRVKIQATLSSGGVIGAAWWAVTIYNGTTQSSQSIRATNAAPDISAQTFSINGSTSNVADQTGVVTFDATNIIITWTKTNSPSGTYQILWEAQ